MIETARLLLRPFVISDVRSTWGLKTLGLPEVLGIVASANVSSCRVLEKSGFVRIADEGARFVYRAA